MKRTCKKHGMFHNVAACMNFSKTLAALFLATVARAAVTYGDFLLRLL